MKTFREYLNEEKFDIDKFIESIKSQLKAFKDSDNKDGIEFLTGILKSYKDNDSLSPSQVQACTKWMKS